MPEISYKDLDDYLKELEDKPELIHAPVYLIFGEELLVKSVYQQLVNKMIPAAAQSLNYEPIDGTSANIGEVIERVNTFSLLPDTKVVSVRDAQFFYAKQDRGRFMEHAKNAYDKSEHAKAANYLLSLMGRLNLSFDDLDLSDPGSVLGVEAKQAWLDDLIEYCRDQNLHVLEPQDECSAIQEAVERGFPENNHLIITTDLVDKRRGLYKAISKTGVVVDCSVPKGDRRADKMAQESVLLDRMASILKAAKKSMDRAAYLAMYEMTGFDLRVFSSNLEKLIDYVGDRDTITIDDVESTLKRTKKDPIYDLTNALADRDRERSLFYLGSILTADFHPLQILSAITNQIRRLIVVKDFAQSPRASGWHPGCSYNRFQTSVLPEMIAFDQDLITHIREWDNITSNNRKPAGVNPARKNKKKISTDLSIVKNPNSPYPVYQLLIKSEQFTKAELNQALVSLEQADSRLKSSDLNPRLILENVILKICRPRESVPSSLTRDDK